MVPGCTPGFIPATEMDAFAFIIHPLDPKRDVARKYPVLGTVLSESTIHFLSRFWPPVQLAHVTGIRSVATEKQIEGWLIAVPYTARRMLDLPVREVYRKIIAAGQLAERLGASILGLGAYTSVVGDGGVSVAQELNIAVTTGDSYTVAVAVDATVMAVRRMGWKLPGMQLAVVGASGAIGRAATQLLAPLVGELLLIGRDMAHLDACGSAVTAVGGAAPQLSTDVADIRQADVVITVTSSGGALIEPDMLKPGAIVCDVSRPRDVSWQAAQLRDDVLVIDGGLVRVPGDVDFGFDYGLPPQLTYGCMAETMALALEGLFEDFSLGKQVTVDRVRRIDAVATRHGFELAALRSFEHALDDASFQRVKAKAYAGGEG